MIPSSERKRLTARQRELYEFVLRYSRAHGRAPTIREIGAACSIPSTNGVTDHLKAIERKGYLRRDPASVRGIEVVDDAAIRIRCPNDDGGAGHVRAVLWMPELSPAQTAERWAGIGQAFGRCPCGAETLLGEKDGAS